MNNGYVTYSGSGYIYSTTDGGNTWNWKGVAPSCLTSIYFIDKNNGIAVGGGNIQRTNNGGNSWTTDIVNGPFPFKSAYITASYNAFAVGGNGVMRNSNILTGYQNYLAENTNDILIYPLPAIDNIIIEIPENTDKGILSIYNISGQKIIEQQMSGNKTKFEISTFPNGMYFLKFSDESGVRTSKFIKQ